MATQITDKMVDEFRWKCALAGRTVTKEEAREMLKEFVPWYEAVKGKLAHDATEAVLVSPELAAIRKNYQLLCETMAAIHVLIEDAREKTKVPPTFVAMPPAGGMAQDNGATKGAAADDNVRPDYLQEGGAMCPYCGCLHMTEADDDWQEAEGRVRCWKVKVTCTECKREWFDIMQLVDIEEIPNADAQ